MKQVIMISLIISVAVVACRKDNDTGAGQPASYSMLKTGNYWVYQVYEVDTNDNRTLLNRTDSCYVEKDTTINGKQYFKLYGAYPNNILPFQYLRDSLHYIVNANGLILFSSADFSTVFRSGHLAVPVEDTVFSYTVKMFDKDMLVSTGAGIFKTSCYRETYQFFPRYALRGLEKRFFERRHAAGVGIVTEVLPFAITSPTYEERRLLRYHAQ